MHIYQTIDEAVAAVQSHNGSPEDFELRMDEKLLDALGVNMAIVTDAILSKGWEPNGFEDCDGHRRFLYR